MLRFALPLMLTAALSSGLQAEPVPRLHLATGRRQDCDPDCGWARQVYKKRADAYVMLPDGRDLGSALIAAGLARRYAGGQRAGWCG
jgi:hypothetical protein